MSVENKSAPIADTQELVLEPMFLSIGDLVLLKQSNQITIPNAYQRNYQAWKLDKYSSFIIGNWRGFRVKTITLLLMSSVMKMKRIVITQVRNS